MNEVRLALRGLACDRAFSLTTITMLALTLALNVTVFVVMDAMLFRGYPLVKQSSRLLFLQERGPSGTCCLSYLDFADWREHATSFEAMAYIGARSITFGDGAGRPVDKRTTTVSANMFQLLGVAPILGRDFVPADEAPGAQPVLMLNHRFWKDRFSKRADIIGATVRINGGRATIIGVMPERFDFPYKIDMDFWMPVTRTPEMAQRGLTPNGFTAVARLRAGVSVEQARAELEAINRRLGEAYPETNRGVVPTTATHSDMNSGPNAAIIWGSTWVGASFVLLIACANLANLTLVRMVGRWREFATKIALGAGQSRMIRQLSIESAALAAVAGIVAWHIARASVRWWSVTTESQYQVLDYTMDSRTLLYLSMITIAAAACLLVPPVVRVIQLGTSEALKGDARGVTHGLRARHLSAGLVITQMALAIVLMSGAGVLVRSFANIVGANSGVQDPEDILVGSVRLPSDAFPDAEARRQYFNRLEATLRTITGVTNTSLASTVPVRFAAVRPFEIDGRPPTAVGDEPIGFVRAGPDYFSVVGVSAISGRVFTEGDRSTGLPVAVVNQSFVDRFWSGQQPIGQRLRSRDRTGAGEWRVVVGVVPNILHNDPLRQVFKPLVYVPFQQEPPALRDFFLARVTQSARVAPFIRAEIQAVDPDVPLVSFSTLKASFAFDRDFMDAEHSELGKHATVAPVFAVIALFLSALGLMAVIAHSVTQRTKEIGVRMAIGAASRDITRMVIREGMTPVAIGVVIGLAASAGVNRVLQSQLVAVSPHDPATLAFASLALTLVAALACQIPARRAAQLDPVVALRNE